MVRTTAAIYVIQFESNYTLSCVDYETTTVNGTYLMFHSHPVYIFLRFWSHIRTGEALVDDFDVGLEVFRTRLTDRVHGRHQETAVWSPRADRVQVLDDVGLAAHRLGVRSTDTPPSRSHSPVVGSMNDDHFRVTAADTRRRRRWSASSGAVVHAVNGTSKVERVGWTVLFWKEKTTLINTSWLNAD